MKVYWTPYILPGLVSEETDLIPNISSTTWPEPELLSKHLASSMFTDTGIHKCPAFTDKNRNTFVLKSPVECSLTKNASDEFECTFDSRTTGPKLLGTRSKELALYTLNIHYLFIPEQSTLLSVSSAAYSLNNFAREAMIVGGEFDLGQFPRPTGCSFFIPPWTNSVSINHGDPLLYTKFTPHDGSKVQLEKFNLTADIYNIIKGNLKAKNSKGLKDNWNLLDYYRMYRSSKQHTYLIKKIKENILN